MINDFLLVVKFNIDLEFGAFVGDGDDEITEKLSRSIVNGRCQKRQR